MNKKNIIKISLIFFILLFITINVYGQCPCTSFVYEFNIQNSGDMAENYQLSLDYFSEYAVFSQNPVIIAAGQSQGVYVYLTIPCSIDGSYSINLVAKAERTGIVTKIPFQVNIRPCFGFSFQLGDDIDLYNITPTFFVEHKGAYSICAGDSRAIPILITNKGNISRKFYFSIKGEKWGSLSAKSLDLEANQIGLVYLSLMPLIEKEGKYNFIFEIGDKDKITKEIEVEVEDCYSFDIYIEKDKDEICGGEEKSYSVKIKNNGNRLNYFNITVEGAEWTNITRDFLGLKAGGEEKLDLIVNPAADEKGNFRIKVLASLTRDLKLKKEDDINLKLSTKEDCYKADIEIGSKRITYKPTTIPIKVKNLGIKKAIYSVRLEAPDWVKVSPSSLTVNPGRESGIVLNTAPSEEIAEGVYNATIKLSTANITYSGRIDLKLKKENLVIKKIKDTIRYYRYYFYLAIILIVIILLVYRPIKRKIIRIKKGILKSRERRKAKREELRRKKEEIRREREKEERKRAELARREEIKKIKERIKKRKRWPYLLLILGIIILAAIVYAFIYFNLYDFSKKILAYLGNIGGYSIYIIGGIFILGVLILIIELIMRRKKVKKIKKEPKVEEIKEEKPIEREAVEEKVAEKKVKKRKINWARYINISVLLGLLVAIYFIFKYFNLMGDVKKIKNFFLIIKGIFKQYSYFIIGGFVILFVLIVIITIIRKIKRKKIKKEIKEAKKEIKKKVKKKWIKPLVSIFAAIIVLGAIVYAFIYYGLVQYIKDFLIVYYWYIIAGIVILIILILIIRFSKPVQKLLEKK